ncbi:MAG: 30S ribosomal protein S3 [Chloroflexi bacterium]|nr:30S ribosomal protein S3 [Chloroflexota bacterium]
MGHKVHPVGLRLGIIKDWHARWYEHRKPLYRQALLEDMRIRQIVGQKAREAGISRMEIERQAQEIRLVIHTARPGIVIGRQGQRVDELRKTLEALTGKKVQVNVQEVRQSELDATLVAQGIADQLERRVAFRRAMRQAVARAMTAGAKGIKVMCAGRLGGREIARREKVMEGRVPLHTLRADIDFAVGEALTVMGRIGVKVWIYKGDVLPLGKEEATPEMSPIQVTVRPTEEGEETKGSEATSVAAQESQVP